MKKKLIVMLTIVLLMFIWDPVLGGSKDSAKIEKVAIKAKLDINILYAGLPETDRAKDFMGFLGKYFKAVTFTDFNAFDENKTAGYDIVILDHDGEAFRAKLPKISKKYSRATITMGVPGAFICSRLSLKTSYL